MEAPTASEIVEAFAFMQADPEMQTRIEQMFDVAEHDVVFQEALASLTNRWKATQRVSVEATVRTALVMGIQMGIVIAEARAGKNTPPRP